MENTHIKIQKYIDEHPWDHTAYLDMVDFCFNKLNEGDLTFLKLACEFRSQLYAQLRDAPDSTSANRWGSLIKKSLLSTAKYDFDSYMQYLEIEREPSKRFYLPRRRALRPLVAALQDLADGVLDLLAISLPPGVGKTTIAIMFLTWIAGKWPEKPNLGGSHSNSFLRGVYDECLRIIQPGEYLWGDVFPKVQLASTNAKDLRIDLGDAKRFETLEFSSIGSGNAGKVRAEGLLYCDDLVEGIEEALSKERMDKLWQQYTTDLRQRKIGDCRELHIATRWSVNDVIGRLQVQYEGSDRARFIAVPALNDKDESNFDYGNHAGFTTAFYHEQRDIMDDASWRALYMNQPIEREGLLYQQDELKRFFDTPEGDPDAIIAVCDTKDRGEDYCVMPVVEVYGQDYYLTDVLCDNSKPEIVDGRMIETLLRNNVQMCRYESNSAGGRIAEKVQDAVTERGGRTRITTKFTSANKETKIIVNSAWVKDHILFKDSSKIQRGSDYDKFIRQLCSYTMMGKNKHDDCPDAIAMLSEYCQSFTGAKIQVFKRPF